MRKQIKLNAVWGHDYDLHTDQIYKCPCCPKCMEEIYKDDSGEYRCYACGKVVDIDDSMQEWFEAREGTKTEYIDCKKIKLRTGTIIGCGGEKTMKITYIKNKASLEWQFACGVCEKCGKQFIV